MKLRKRKRKLKNSFRDIKEFRSSFSSFLIGPAGAGKTTFATALFIKDFKKNYKFRLKNSNQYVVDLYSRGFDKVNYTDNFYYSTVNMLLNPKKQFETLFTNFSFFGLPTGDKPIHNYAFNSLLFFDEPETDIDSRKFKEFDSERQYGAFKLKRHKGLNIIMAVHDAWNIEKRIRNDVSFVEYIYGSSDKKFLFLFKRKTWYTRRYYSAYGRKFIEMGFTGDLPTEKHLRKYVEWRRYTFWGNIYKRVDSMAFAPNWLENKPFSNINHLSSRPFLKTLPEHRKMYGFGRQKEMFDKEIKKQLSNLKNSKQTSATTSTAVPLQKSELLLKK